MNKVSERDRTANEKNNEECESVFKSNITGRIVFRKK